MACAKSTITADNLDEYLSKSKTMSKMRSDIDRVQTSMQGLEKSQSDGFARLEALLLRPGGGAASCGGA
eukprot:11537986-Karenia_brevis.AAC.1